MNNTSFNPGASSAAIQHHYDVSNDFYKLWLDPTMTYSCALWQENESLNNLELAQIRKIDYHIQQAQAANAQRVLDIGCGWGGVLERVTQVHGAKQGVGLTLSQAQADHISSLDLPSVDVYLESWRDHHPTLPYDAIISIGAFEHFTKAELTSEQKIKVYREFFQRCHSWLNPSRMMSLQTIAYGKRPPEEVQKCKGAQFGNQEIFPESDSPRLAEIAIAAEGIFEIVALRNDRLDYARTLEVWLKNLQKKRAEITAELGEKIYNRYHRYLYLAFLGFIKGDLTLLRITLRRID